MRIALTCLPGRGHLYPAAALALVLKARGHEVTLISSSSGRAFARNQGLAFRSLGPRLGRTTPSSLESVGSSVPVTEHATAGANVGRNILKDEQVDCVLVDQADLIFGSVAESLGIPFVNLAFFPPVYFQLNSPPFIVTWPSSHHRFGMRQIHDTGQQLLHILKPALQAVNHFRYGARLATAPTLNELFSRKAIITQMPGELELPGVHLPEHVRYTNLFSVENHTDYGRFPWDKLTDRPLVYVTLGTVQNQTVSRYHLIAASLRNKDVQVVISLGGTLLTPDMIPDLGRDAIVVHYAPQAAILARASLVICHGGMNTCLEAVIAGVPLLCLPITDDQPGVSARVRAHGLGSTLRMQLVSLRKLSGCVDRLLSSPKLYERCANFACKLTSRDGALLAAKIIEDVL